jgi:ribonuclease HI
MAKRAERDDNREMAAADVYPCRDVEHLAEALEHVLRVQRLQDDAPHLDAGALERLNQAAGALLAVLRAVAGMDRASEIYADVCRRSGQQGTAPQTPKSPDAPQAARIAALSPTPTASETLASSPLFPEAATGAEERTAADTTSRSPAPAATDIGQFDGSADPNPDGRMGMGWHLTMRDGTEESGASEQAPAPGNSNNQAEYLALLALLAAYTEAGGRGPLLVRGDSQLVISQMTGAWAVRNPALRPLYERAQRAARAIPGGVCFDWVPRHLNSRADRLAGGKPPASSGVESLTYAVNPLQDVAAPLAQQIATLNAQGSASFKECLALRVGGRDRCSEMRWRELAAAAGTECAKVCAAAFPDDVSSQTTALRWVVRGLAVQLAVKKVQIDQQLLTPPSGKQGAVRQAGQAGQAGQHGQR